MKKNGHNKKSLGTSGDPLYDAEVAATNAAGDLMRRAEKETKATLQVAVEKLLRKYPQTETVIVFYMEGIASELHRQYTTRHVAERKAAYENRGSEGSARETAQNLQGAQAPVRKSGRGVRKARP